MAFLVGIDEAGYGPNLGPLVVAATAWEVAEGSGFRVQGSGEDLYARLAEVVAPGASDERIAIADSKRLYHSGGSLRQLERGVLVGLRAGGEDAPARLVEDAPAPVDTAAEEIAVLTRRFTIACGFAGVRLATVRVRMVFPREFNSLCTQWGTKGAALSHVSVGLLREVMAGFANSADRVSITCDKHGGRNRYAALLQHHFPDEWIETLEEGRSVSRYAWGPAESRCQIRFRTKGESELPVALASMAAKYHRELAMRAFNEFWCREVPGLRPTAGYPADARRFFAAIAPRLGEMGIDKADVWREK